MRKNSFTISAVGVCLIAFLAVAPAQNTITTLAGGGPNNLPALSASIGAPWAVVQHGTTTYISDNLSNRIFQVDSKGVLTVLAGNIMNGFTGETGPANLASMSNPEGIALDSAGNVYVADTGNNVIRVINMQTTDLSFYNGALTIHAGDIAAVVSSTGQAGYSTGSGPVPAATAQLNGPGGLWLDQHDNIYIADTANSVIEVINVQSSQTITVAGTSIPAGDIATIAGTNIATFGGDGGPAKAAAVNRPQGIFLDSAGTIYIADTLNQRIRVINPNTSGSIKVAGVTIPHGDINTVAGNGTACANSQTACGDGNSAINANLNSPSGLFADSSENIYIADTNDNKIRKVLNGTDTAHSTISTIAGTGAQCVTIPCGQGGAATSAQLWAPTGVILDESGNVLIADQNDDAIRNIVSGKLQTTVGAILNTSYSGDKSATVAGVPTDAELRFPAGVASDANGNVFIADSSNNAIRKVSNGVITTVAGNGIGCSFVNLVKCGDGGPATAAEIGFPNDVVFDASGNMFIADSGDNAIREVNSQGTIVSVAGDGQVCADPTTPCGDGGAATAAQLNLPNGVFVDSTGNIFIADTDDNRVRLVNTQATPLVLFNNTLTIQPGDIATVAGDGTACADPTTPCGDTGPAVSAQLNAPGSVWLDSAGNIYISDSADNRVRIVDTTGTINPFAGNGTACSNSCGDGGAALNANLDGPQALFIDHAGNVFIADALDFVVREVTTDGNINTVAGDINAQRGYSGDGGPATSAQLAIPIGVAGDPFGNLLISDTQEWRVRTVTDLVITLPRAALSPASVNFPAQALKTKSAAIPVTLSNVGNGMNLTITKVAISGANPGDFAETNNCSSVPGPGSCTINVTITPSASGARSAVLMVTDNAAGSPQTINLSGTGADFTIPTTGTLSSPTISAGSSTTATVTITPGGGLTATIDLTCAVTPATAVPPTCSLSPSSLAPGTTKSTLTVKTVAATSGALTAPSIVRRSAPLYAVWLLLPGMLLSTAGMGASRRRKLLSYFLIFCAIAGCLFLVACGGGGSSGGGGGGGGGGAGTTAGSYTVKVTAKTSTTTQSETFPLTVQ